MTASTYRHRRIVCISLLLALLASAFFAGAADAAWRGRDGAIAFVRGPHIWAQLPSGKQRQLTDEAEGADTEPTYTRDGRTIAFVRYEGNGSHIWVMNSDGTEQRRGTGAVEGAYEAQPAFFPAGPGLALAPPGAPSRLPPGGPRSPLPPPRRRYRVGRLLDQARWPRRTAAGERGEEPGD